MAYSIKANEHFKVQNYTGDGQSDATTPGFGQDISGVGFQPGMTWIQGRSVSTSFEDFIVTSLFGAGRYLSWNNDSGGNYNSNNSQMRGLSNVSVLSAFLSDGFTVNQHAGDPGQTAISVNENGETYASYNWKLSTSTTTDTSGDITSEYRNNQTAGISIFRYTGNGVTMSSNRGDGQRIAHGLGGIPDTVFLKNVSNTAQSAGFWYHYHSLLTGFNRFNYISYDESTTTQTTGLNITDGLHPTDEFIRLGHDDNINVDGDTYIGIAFKNIPGFSSFGLRKSTRVNSFSNSFANTITYTGFKPGLLVAIPYSTSAGGNNYAVDCVNPGYSTRLNGRDTWGFGRGVGSIFSNTDRFTAWSILNNGFKSLDSPGSQYDWFYMAFAKEGLSVGGVPSTGA